MSTTRRGLGLLLAGALCLSPLAAVSPAAAADGTVASGPNYTVTQAAGGYLVTVDLDKKLPIVSDAPTIEVDGMTTATPMLPSAGTQGDACAELAASRTKGVVSAADETPAPGDTVAFSASGYRVGEGVTFSLGSTTLGVGTADESGKAVLSAVVPNETAIGVTGVTAVGAGSKYVSEGSVEVLYATTTTLSMSPEIPEINEDVTLTAAVAGTDTAGTVEFFDGTTSLGTAEVDEGVATLELDGFKAGDHALTAVFGQTATAQSSESDVVGLTLTKGKSGIALVLAADSAVYGSGVRGSVAVANGDGGSVTLTYGGAKVQLPLGGSDSASFSLPKNLAVGRYTVGATFDGTDKVEPSGLATAGFQVTKKATSASISAKSSIKRGKKLTVKTTVRGATAGTFPTGTVKVYVKTGKGAYKLKKTVALTAGKRGVANAYVTVTKKKATIRVKTVYSGSGSYGGSSTGTKVVKVK